MTCAQARQMGLAWLLAPPMASFALASYAVLRTWNGLSRVEGKIRKSLRMIIPCAFASSVLSSVPSVTGPYWQAEVFALVYLAFSLPIALHLLTHPAVLLRRLRGGPLAEPEPSQKLIVSLVLLCILAMGVVLALDHEYGWSDVPAYAVLLGDLLVAGGLIVIWLVFRANPFAAAAVNVEIGQAVISTGPYALVRHPMYSAGLLLFLGIPVALGSWWGLVFFLPLLALIIWRLLDEEAYLSAHLPGYRDYCAKVRHRLLPAIW